MGTSGARKGYKIFSINTTIRNPLRNKDFLKEFYPYNNKVFDQQTKLNFYRELISKGIYKSTNIPLELLKKINNGEFLNPKEVDQILYLNPQKTGHEGRLMTQLRSLKDQGLLIFQNSSKKPLIRLSKLGQDLIDNKISSEDTYTKLFLSLHTKNPDRKSINNEARPFLNLLFIMDGLNKIYKSEKVSLLEFGTFILTMKNCDYNKTLSQIINYRNKNGFKENPTEIQNHLNHENIVKYPIDTIYDYADEVYRKFEMTNLIASDKHGHIRFIVYNQFNIKKIEMIIREFSGYLFQIFNTIVDYENFLFQTVLPWKNKVNINQVIESKAKILNIDINTLSSENIDEIETELDKLYSNEIIAKIIDDYREDEIIKELTILAGSLNQKSMYKDKISEPLRLEFFLSLLIAGVLGTNKLIPNLILSPEGVPLSNAPGNKADIVFESPYKNDGIVFEPTMIRNKAQQLNNETTTVARHLLNLKKTKNKNYRAIMIAPFVHWDTVNYYKYTSYIEKVKMLPVSISFFISLMLKFKGKQMDDFFSSIDQLVDNLLTLSTDELHKEVNDENSKYLF